MKDKITNGQLDFYNHNRQELIDQYLSHFPLHIDPDAVRDRFALIGYDRSNVQKFQGICKLLTKDIFHEALSRSKDKVRKVIFAAGLPASGKTSHLKKMAQDELIYDGTINDEKKFIELIQTILGMGGSLLKSLYILLIQKELLKVILTEVITLEGMFRYHTTKR